MHYWLLLFIFLPSVLLGQINYQQPSGDDLKAYIANPAISLSEKTDSIMTVRMMKYLQSCTNEELEPVKQFIAGEISKTSSLKEQAEWLFIKGFIARRKRELTDGITSFERRLELVKQLKDTLAIIDSYGHLGWLYGAFDMKDESLNYMKERMKITIAYGDTNQIVQAAGSLGWNLTNEAMRLKNKAMQDSAVYYLEMAYNYCSKNHEDLDRIIIYCMALARADKQEKAIEVLKKTLQLPISKASVYYARYIKQIGHNYSALGIKDSAFYYYNWMLAAEQHRLDTTNKELLQLPTGKLVDPFSYFNLISCHARFEEYQKAAKMLDLVLYGNYPKENKGVITFYQSYGKDIYYKAGEYKKSADCSEAYAAYKDTLNEQKFEKYNEANKAHSEVQIAMEKERSQMQKEQQEKLAAEQEATQQIITTAFVLGILLLVVILFIIYSRFKLAKKHEEEIRKQKEGVEEVVKVRTQEISDQKKKIEKTYKDAELLHEIGKEITTHLAINDINKAVYEKINKLMEADGFGIGVLDKETGRLSFPGYIEDGVTYEETSYDVNDKDRLACVCFNKEIEILIGDTATEMNLYIENFAAPVVGGTVKSVIYVPLVLKEKKVGVITVQSFKMNAFSDYHINIIRNIATHTAIALDNAQIYESLEDKVAERTMQVMEQKQEIIDSINYAKRIQEAILPPEDLLNKMLGNYFVFYKPKDIVAGDFYWMESIGEVVYFAAADCTGHGVPGAMVSVVCSNALSKSLVEEKITDVGKLLDRTRELVVGRFGRSGSDIKDGMDVSICAFNKNTKMLQWAGANNSLLLVRGKESAMEEIKPNKQPIGRYDNYEPFTAHSVKLKKGDVIYIFTDGYPDQFGGEKGKKLKYRPFKDLLLQNFGKPMEEQNNILTTAFDDWKGDLEQVDDVCIIGVQVD